MIASLVYPLDSLVVLMGIDEVVHFTCSSQLHKNHAKHCIREQIELIVSVYKNQNKLKLMIT